MTYWRIIPYVWLSGGRSQVTLRLVELVFEIFTFKGGLVGAVKDKTQHFNSSRKSNNLQKNDLLR